MRRAILSAAVAGLILLAYGANGVFGEPAVDSDAVKRSELEQQYVELVKEQAALMEQEHLQAQIQQTKKGIEQLKAAKLLQSAEQSLKQIAEQYPETFAAQTAREASQLIESKRPKLVKEAFVDPSDGTPRVRLRAVPTYLPSVEVVPREELPKLNSQR